MECSICYDQIQTQLTGKVELSCSHAFHFSCLTTWFSTQATNQITQSCPCCRHESNPHETMPFQNTQGPTPMDEDEEEDTSMFSTADLAAMERAAFRFAKLKREMSKNAFEAYAASKIAALYRGRCARYILSEIKEIKDWLQTSTCKYFIQKRNMHNDRKALAFNMKALTMSYSAWRNYVASIVQRAWRKHYTMSKIKRQILITDTTMTVMISV